MGGGAQTWTSRIRRASVKSVWHIRYIYVNVCLYIYIYIYKIYMYIQTHNTANLLIRSYIVEKLFRYWFTHKHVECRLYVHIHNVKGMYGHTLFKPARPKSLGSKVQLLFSSLCWLMDLCTYSQLPHRFVPLCEQVDRINTAVKWDIKYQYFEILLHPLIVTKYRDLSVILLTAFLPDI